MANFKFMLWLFAAFMIIAGPAHAETTIDDAPLVSHLIAKVVQTGTVSVSGSSVDWVKMNMTIPQDTESQKASDALGKIQDEFGNFLWAYEKNSPGNTFSYSGETRVEAYARATRELPASYAIPDGIKKYMLPTPGMQSNDGRIISLAKKITGEKPADFEKIAALASYVHNYVNYTKSLGTTAKDALWVLDNKIGTCDEYSALFIALARALGYPARYVSGYAFGDGGWIPHAWAEVYLGTWVPVDPTWLEVGWLDATHIQFHVSRDNKVENSAEAYGAGTKTVDWTSSETKIETLSADVREKTQKYSVFQTSETLEPGEKTVVVLRIFPEEYAAIEATLEPCRGKTKIANVENKTQEAAIMPGREKIMFWVVSAEEGLPKDMIYTCPLVLNSRYLGEKRLDVKVDTSGREESRADISADPKSQSVLLGENETIFVSSKMVSGPGQYKIGVVSENYYGEAYAAGASSGQFTYAPGTPGKNSAIAFSSTGQIEVIEYAVSQTSEGTRISSVSVPAFAKVGVPEKISVTVKIPGSIKQSVRLSANIDGKDAVIQSFEAASSKTITFDYAPESAGEKTIRFELSGNSASDSRRLEKFRAYEVPELEATLSEDFGKNLAVVRIESLKDTAENVSVDFLGGENPIGHISGTESAEFKITEYGIKEAIATFYDAAGNRHTTTFYLDVKEEGFFQKIIRYLLSFLGK